MPTCQNCGKDWTWKQTFKWVTSFKQGLKCPYCDSKQYESARSRRKTSLVSLSPLILILPMNIFFDFNLLIGIPILIGMLLAIFSLYPFMLKLSNEEEPYW